MISLFAWVVADWNNETISNLPQPQKIIITLLLLTTVRERGTAQQRILKLTLHSEDRYSCNTDRYVRVRVCKLNHRVPLRCTIWGTLTPLSTTSTNATYLHLLTRLCWSMYLCMQAERERVHFAFASMKAGEHSTDKNLVGWIELSLYEADAVFGHCNCIAVAV